MSDETTPTPAANGGQQQGQQGQQTPAQQQQPAAQEQGQPEPAPFAVFKDEASLNNRLKRAERSALNRVARENGFEDWTDMQDALGAIRRTPGNAGGQQATPPPAAQQEQSKPDPLKLKIQVATAKGLPVTLVERLQGETKEEMEADADRLLALFANAGQQQRAPGIPPVPQSGIPVTFTRTQLQDAEFVRKNKDAILQAGREGRIVNS